MPTTLCREYEPARIKGCLRVSEKLLTPPFYLSTFSAAFVIYSIRYLGLIPKCQRVLVFQCDHLFSTHPLGWEVIHFTNIDSACFMGQAQYYAEINTLPVLMGIFFLVRKTKNKQKYTMTTKLVKKNGRSRR